MFSDPILSCHHLVLDHLISLAQLSFTPRFHHPDWFWRLSFWESFLHQHPLPNVRDRVEPNLQQNMYGACRRHGAFSFTNDGLSEAKP